jgi:hypothetical protein
MQPDGNLVLYDDTHRPQALWSTDTWAGRMPAGMVADHAIMQADGNFVLYTNRGVPVWSTGTWAQGGTKIVLQDDRDLVIYRPDGTRVWWSHTHVEAGNGGVGLPPLPNQNEPVRGSKMNEEVGWGKHMDTSATLYRDGRLVVDSYERNDNWFGALRSEIIVVCVDPLGRSQWVSEVFKCATRCSVPDVSCASYGRQTFQQALPEAVGKWTSRLDIYQADNPDYDAFRRNLINFIHTLKDLVPDVKDVLHLLA